jgi:hypothetical protein
MCGAERRSASGGGGRRRRERRRHSGQRPGQQRARTAHAQVPERQRVVGCVLRKRPAECAEEEGGGGGEHLAVGCSAGGGGAASLPASSWCGIQRPPLCTRVTNASCTAAWRPIAKLHVCWGVEQRAARAPPNVRAAGRPAPTPQPPPPVQAGCAVHAAKNAPVRCPDARTARSARSAAAYGGRATTPGRRRARRQAWSSRHASCCGRRGEGCPWLLRRRGSACFSQSAVRRPPLPRCRPERRPAGCGFL